MDALVFGEDELSGFIPKTSLKVTAMVLVVSWFGIKSVITANQTLNGTPNSQPYCERIVLHEVVPFLNQGQGNTFKQDNAWPYTVRQTKDVLWQSNINVLKWTTK
jgi:hypothetical protein